MLAPESTTAIRPICHPGMPPTTIRTTRRTIALGQAAKRRRAVDLGLARLPRLLGLLAWRVR